MNGMLLAAGRGERMEPLSSFVAKPALEVLGRPLAASAWKHLAPHCQRVVANLHRHSDVVAAALANLVGDGSPLLFSREAELLGGAGGVAAARPLFDAGPVLVANTDVWADLDMAPLLAAADEDMVALAVLPHPDPQRWSSIRLDGDGRVVDFVRSWDGAGEPYLFTGFQLLGSRVVAGLPAPPCEFAPVWRALQNRGMLRAVVVQGSWIEVGTPLAYWRLVTSLVAGESWLHDTSDIAHDSCVKASAVGGRCRVGRGALVEQCVLTAGAAVSPDCSLRRCVVAGAVSVPTALELADVLVLPTGIVPLN